MLGICKAGGHEIQRSTQSSNAAYKVQFVCHIGCVSWLSSPVVAQDSDELMDSSLELLRKCYAEELSKGPGANQARIAELREGITFLATTTGNAALSTCRTAATAAPSHMRSRVHQFIALPTMQLKASGHCGCCNACSR